MPPTRRRFLQKASAGLTWAALAASSGRVRGETGEYLKRYYIGHYNPLGNFFTVRDLLDRGAGRGIRAA